MAQGTGAGLVSYRGDQIFSFEVNIPAETRLVANLTYEEILVRNHGISHYEVSLDTVHTFDQTSLQMDLYSSISLGPAGSSLGVPDGDEHHRWISYSGAQLAGFELNYSLDAYPDGGIVIDDGEHFVQRFAPDGSEVGVMAKDVVFVLDSSGSMSGRKMTQTKDAMTTILPQLASDDRFNLVEFDSASYPWQDGLVDATTSNIAAADIEVQSYSADGGTNMGPALGSALTMLYDEGRLTTAAPLIVFLTDGQNNGGPASALDAVRSGNADHAVAVYPLAFGDGADWEFLVQMAEENDGFATHIWEGDDAAEQLAEFFAQISTPLLREIQFSYGLEVEAFPSEASYLFEGQEIVVVGHYNDSSASSISPEVTATAAEGVAFHASNAQEIDVTHDFVERLWAMKKIQSLMHEILLNGSSDPLRNEIITLGLQYHLVTAYTSLVVEMDPEHKADPEANPQSLDTHEDSLTGAPGSSGFTSPDVDAAPADEGGDIGEAFTTGLSMGFSDGLFTIGAIVLIVLVSLVAIIPTVRHILRPTRLVKEDK